jgi:hypothetical protein
LRIALIPAGVDPSISDCIFDRTVIFMCVRAVRVSAFADIRADVTKVTCHLFSDDIPKFKLTDAGSVDHI